MVQITFNPENDSEIFLQSKNEYQSIWQKYGSQIILNLELFSTLKFTEKHVTAILIDGPSYSGKSKSAPMKLRYSYDKDTKLATLIHEFGHRILFDRKFDNEHFVLDLFLFDAWCAIKNPDFANQQVKIESDRTGLNDYNLAWQSALELNFSQRQDLLKQFLL